MTPQRWQRLEELVAGALARPQAEHRDFLRSACEDSGLVVEAERFLAGYSAASDFLATPAPEPRESPAALPLLPGTRLGTYRVLRQIGEGGMATVYLAERADRAYFRKVAIKVLRRHGAGALLRRFRTERKILAHLDHPSIARLLEAGTTADDRPYFVMEHVEGSPIDVYCRGRGLEERLALLRQVCEAVEEAHRNLIVHSDLKPGNILVTPDGKPKLLDFGIAKILEPGSFPETIELTAGLRPMTVQYASPEQLAGAPLTTASDVYALGLILYEILTGKRPYDLQDRQLSQIIQMVCEQDPVRPSLAVLAAETDSQDRDHRREHGRRASRRLAGDLDNIVLKALEKDPRHRYGTSRELGEDLGRHLDGRPVRARRRTLAYRTSKLLRRHVLAVSLGALFLVSLLVLSAFLWLQSARLHRERDRARIRQEHAEQVTALLTEIFSSPAPSRARGQELTVREALDQGVLEIERKLENQPLVQASLLLTVASTYRELGLYDKALGRLEKARELHRGAGGKPAVLARILDDLARVQDDRGLYEEAEALAFQALRLRQRHFGQEHLEVAASFVTLGEILISEGRYDEAEGWYARALQSRREILGEDDLESANILHDLASLMGRRGDLAGAADLHREALAIFKQVGSEEHPAMATTLHDLAWIELSRGDLEASLALHEEALRRRRKLLGKDHPKTLKTMTNFAATLRKAGELERAEPLLREALAGRRRWLGENHPQVANGWVNLGQLLVDTGRGAEAELCFRKSLEIVDTSLPEAHPNRAYPRIYLGRLLCDHADWQEAEGFLREALALRQAALRPEHELIATARQDLDECLARHAPVQRESSLETSAALR